VGGDRARAERVCGVGLVRKNSTNFGDEKSTFLRNVGQCQTRIPQTTQKDRIVNTNTVQASNIAADDKLTRTKQRRRRAVICSDIERCSAVLVFFFFFFVSSYGRDRLVCSTAKLNCGNNFFRSVVRVPRGGSTYLKALHTQDNKSRATCQTTLTRRGSQPAGRLSHRP
jgi:hypothetical protein